MTMRPDVLRHNVLSPLSTGRLHFFSTPVRFPSKRFCGSRDLSYRASNQDVSHHNTKATLGAHTLKPMGATDVGEEWKWDLKGAGSFESDGSQQIQVISKKRPIASSSQHSLPPSSSENPERSAYDMMGSSFFQCQREGKARSQNIATDRHALGPLLDFSPLLVAGKQQRANFGRLVRLLDERNTEWRAALKSAHVALHGHDSTALHPFQARAQLLAWLLRTTGYGGFSDQSVDQFSSRRSSAGSSIRLSERLLSSIPSMNGSVGNDTRFTADLVANTPSSRTTVCKDIDVACAEIIRHHTFSDSFENFSNNQPSPSTPDVSLLGLHRGLDSIIFIASQALRMAAVETASALHQFLTPMLVICKTRGEFREESKASTSTILLSRCFTLIIETHLKARNFAAVFDVGNRFQDLIGVVTPHAEGRQGYERCLSRLHLILLRATIEVSKASERKKRWKAAGRKPASVNEIRIDLARSKKFRADLRRLYRTVKSIMGAVPLVWVYEALKALSKGLEYDRDDTVTQQRRMSGGTLPAMALARNIFQAEVLDRNRSDEPQKEIGKQGFERLVHIMLDMELNTASILAKTHGSEVDQGLSTISRKQLDPMWRLIELLSRLEEQHEVPDSLILAKIKARYVTVRLFLLKNNFKEAANCFRTLLDIPVSLDDPQLLDTRLAVRKLLRSTLIRLVASVVKPGPATQSSISRNLETLNLTVDTIRRGWWDTSNHRSEGLKDHSSNLALIFRKLLNASFLGDVRSSFMVEDSSWKAFETFAQACRFYAVRLQAAHSAINAEHCFRAPFRKAILKDNSLDFVQKAMEGIASAYNASQLDDQLRTTLKTRWNLLIDILTQLQVRPQTWEAVGELLSHLEKQRGQHGLEDWSRTVAKAKNEALQQWSTNSTCENVESAAGNHSTEWLVEKRASGQAGSDSPHISNFDEKGTPWHSLSLQGLQTSGTIIWQGAESLPRETFDNVQGCSPDEDQKRDTIVCD